MHVYAFIKKHQYNFILKKLAFLNREQCIVIAQTEGNQTFYYCSYN